MLLNKIRQVSSIIMETFPVGYYSYKSEIKFFIYYFPLL